MSEPRVSMLDLPAAASAAARIELPTPLAELHIFRTLLHNPALAKATSDLLLTLLFRSSLDPRLRELVIMRIGWRTEAVYEWTQHWKIALEQFGCSEQDLLGVRDWQSAAHFGEAECAVLRATDEMLETGTLSDDTWSECHSVLADELTRIELVTTIATWHWISQVTRSLDIPLEHGVPPWPPDGRTPST